MIGDYRHVVTLTTAGDPAIDDAGGYAEAGVPLDPATWHCSIAAASARDLERVGGGQVSSTASHVIRGRYHPGLTEHGRIQFGSRVFEVESVHDRDERQLEIEVIARELLVRVVTPTRTSSKADESSNAE
jgi:head-tail adaptor